MTWSWRLYAALRVRRRAFAPRHETADGWPHTSRDPRRQLSCRRARVSSIPVALCASPGQRHPSWQRWRTVTRPGTTNQWWPPQWRPISAPSWPYPCSIVFDSLWRPPSVYRSRSTQWRSVECSRQPQRTVPWKCELASPCSDNRSCRWWESPLAHRQIVRYPGPASQRTGSCSTRSAGWSGRIAGGSSVSAVAVDAPPHCTDPKRWRWGYRWHRCHLGHPQIHRGDRLWDGKSVGFLMNHPFQGKQKARWNFNSLYILEYVFHEPRCVGYKLNFYCFI